MISLSNIQVHIPEGRQALESCAQDLSLNRFETQMFRRFHGLSDFAIADDASLSDHLKTPQDLAKRTGPKPDYTFHCHTIPTITPNGSSPLGACSAGVTAGVTMAHCAGPLVVLDLLSETLRPGETARILIGEKSFHPKIKMIPNITIMSDIAVSIDVSLDHGICRRIDSETCVNGSVALNSGLDDQGGIPAEFEAVYIKTLTDAVFGVLARHDMTWSDLAWVFPHNVNVSSWRSFAKMHSLDLNKIYLGNVSRFGHAFGADPFLNLEMARTANEVRPGQRALLVSVGLGMTANATLIEFSPPPFPTSKHEDYHAIT